LNSTTPGTGFITSIIAPNKLRYHASASAIDATGNNTHQTIRTMLGFKVLHSATAPLAGIETAHMIHKGRSRSKWCVAFRAVRGPRRIIVSSVCSHSASKNIYNRARPARKNLRARLCPQVELPHIPTISARTAKPWGSISQGKAIASSASACCTPSMAEIWCN